MSLVVFINPCHLSKFECSNMHVLIRSSHFRNRPLNVIKRQHSNQALTCLCEQRTNRKRNVYVPYSQERNNLTSLLRFNNTDRLFFIAHSNLHVRNLSLSSIRFDQGPLQPSSKVEESVQEIKKSKEDAVTAAPPKEVVKKTLKQKIIAEIVHYYHGFRLLFIDIKIASVLVFRILKGEQLTRREHKMLIRTVGDVFRLLPFSVFIIVPFMEFLLPVFIKFFPNMLPSTFQTATEQQDKLKRNLGVKIEMAKFLQKTLDSMATQHIDRRSEQAKQFHEWFQKVRNSGADVSNEDIMKYCKLFEDEITLDSLSRSQLTALCRVLEVQTLGTNNFLRFQLRMKLRSLAADDQMIQKEGVNSLNLSELQAACRARGMRAYGVSESRLRTELRKWLDLSLNEKVPPSLLLLSRALMLPEAIPTSDKLKATISSLPETVIAQTKYAIGEKEGKIDNKAKFEAIVDEERKIKEERAELSGEQIKEEKEAIDKAPIVVDKVKPMVDKAPIITDDAIIAAKSELKPKDLEVIEAAIVNIAKDQKKLIVEKERIQDLKEEMADYQEDVQDLKKITADQPRPLIRESKAAQRLFKRVNKLITNLDNVMTSLEEKKQQKGLHGTESEEKKQELVHINDIMDAIRKIQDVPNDSRAVQIESLLKKMDDDFDGSVKVEHVLKVLEMIGKDNVNLSNKQLEELIVLVGKEEIIEVEDKIEKALQKEKEQHVQVLETPISQPQPIQVKENTDSETPKESSLESLSRSQSSNSSVPPTASNLDISSSSNVQSKQRHIASELPPKAAIPPIKDTTDLKKLEKR